MGAKATRDFASVLDDLLASGPGEPEPRPAPSLRVDLLDQIERIQSNSSTFGGEPVLEQYRAAARALEEAAERVVIEPERLPSIEPAEIAAELALPAGAGPAELDRCRRAFALSNHPDRVVPHLRDRALVRMQVANRLVDEAKARGAGG